MVGIIVILFLLVSLIINGFVATKFKEIAEMKGHEGDTYFWCTFFLGVVGMLMVIALPNNNQKNNHTGVKTQLPPPKDIFAKVRTNTTTDTVKRCPYCGDVVKLGKCEMCGKEVK